MKYAIYNEQRFCYPNQDRPFSLSFQIFAFIWTSSIVIGHFWKFTDISRLWSPGVVVSPYAHFRKFMVEVQHVV